MPEGAAHRAVCVTGGVMGAFVIRRGRGRERSKVREREGEKEREREREGKRGEVGKGNGRW